MTSIVAGLAVIILLVIIIYSRTSKPSIYCSDEDHRRRTEHLVAALRTRPPGSKISLHHRTLQSNTIRNGTHKSNPSYSPIDLSSFNHLIRIDHQALCVVCEPGVSFGDLVKELLKVGLTPLVVPELPGITVGGAIAGGGLESSSHQHGQVSDTVLEIECLTPELRVCSPDHDSDLFYAISASYNTVALMTGVRLKVAPAPQYLSLKAVRYSTFGDAIEAIQADAVSDTIEGIAYSSSEIIVIRGKHCSSPTSTIRRFSRHWDRWYHKSVRTTSEMTIPYLDYCFRYNYGSFWMADYVLEMLGGDNLFTRFLIGSFLDTKHLFAVLHSANLMDLGRMRVIQDCYIPAARTLEFLNAIDEEIGVYPLWLCPISGTTTAQVLASHHTDSGGDFINVGIYGRPRQFPYDPKRVHSRLIEHLLRLEGRPMLYAQTWHTPGQFEAMYGDALRQVEAVKARHGEKGCLFGLYEKVALSDVERAELGKSMIGTEAEETRKVVRCILGKKLGLL